MSRPDAPSDLLAGLIEMALKAGAEAADALLIEAASASLSCRLGKTEDIERAESTDIGLRVLIGRRQAVVSTSDPSPAATREMVERAIAMAKVVPEDRFCGLADPDLLARDIPNLDEFDGAEPSAEWMIETALKLEDAARAVDGVSNSEGAGIGFSKSTLHLVASNGFSGRRQGSHFSIGVSVLAGTGTGMERDGEYVSAVHLEDLPDPTSIGTEAGRRAVRRLGPQKAESATLPIIYDPRVAKSLVGHLAGAINGQAVARGTTFLKDALGKQLFGAGIRIVDDPLRQRGLRSKPFDGEGIATAERDIVQAGVLQSWILDLATSRQLGMKTTGHASRGTGGPPSPSATNLYMAPGRVSRDELIGGVEAGFYVTELIGMGVNGVTGDYSRGAAGFWIERGEITHPVNEVTIAGNLKDMFLNMTPADDLEFKYGTNAPTLRVDGMMLAGR